MQDVHDINHQTFALACIIRMDTQTQVHREDATRRDISQETCRLEHTHTNTLLMCKASALKAHITIHKNAKCIADDGADVPPAPAPATYLFDRCLLCH